MNWRERTRERERERERKRERERWRICERHILMPTISKIKKEKAFEVSPISFSFYRDSSRDE